MKTKIAVLVLAILFTIGMAATEIELPDWGDSVDFTIYTMTPYAVADAAGNYVAGKVIYE